MPSATPHTSVLKRLQRHAPSWLEQLPQLPDVVMDNLQSAQDLEQRFSIQQQKTKHLQDQVRESVRWRRTLPDRGPGLRARLLSALLPGAWQQVAQAPPVSWILAGLALALLWPREA